MQEDKAHINPNFSKEIQTSIQLNKLYKIMSLLVLKNLFIYFILKNKEKRKLLKICEFHKPSTLSNILVLYSPDK